MNQPAAPALALHGISRRFGHVTALESASLIARAGTVHALLGENGAGKTTLMRIAFGLLRPDAGTVERDGARVHLAGPRDAIAAGIGMVHQHFSLVREMTVAENLSLGRTGPFSYGGGAEFTRSAHARFGLSLDANARVADLPVAAQQRVEIAKALLRDARVLILDEPTAVLAPTDASELLQKLRVLAQAGTTVILITHKLADALRVADDVTVLRQGRTVLTAPTAETSVDALVEAMLGSGPVATDRVARLDDTGADVLVARDISVLRKNGSSALANASLRVRRGEIVGVAGVEGSGHHELLRVLAGRLAPSAGEVTRPPYVGFIPEDRHRDALILDFSLRDNVALAGAGARGGTMPWRTLDAETAALLARQQIDGHSSTATARSLSGGNQQRLVVGRELLRAGGVIVAENPTRGLDVNATARVHRDLRAAAQAGAGVVVYSSDLDELTALSDRVVVCFAGQLANASRDVNAIGRAMVGAASEAR
jgi:ABC-type uncharacterized transport system ATPase subunit